MHQASVQRYLFQVLQICFQISADLPLVETLRLMIFYIVFEVYLVMGNLLKKDLENKADDDEEFTEIFVEDVQNTDCSDRFTVEAGKTLHRPEIFIYQSEFEIERASTRQVGDNFEDNMDESVAEKLSNADMNCKVLLEKWRAEQLELRKQLILSESENLLDNLSYIGGVDISFPSNHEDLVHACACLVVMSYPQLEIVYKSSKIVHLTSVYIPEYLAFREVGPLVELCNEMKLRKPELYPQLILVDGNGLLHPRKFGIACHLGVMLNLSTIGVAKKLFHVEGLQKNDSFKDEIKRLCDKGACFPLVGCHGYVYGKALRSTAASSNPIYVSIGHMVSLETAVSIASKCCKVRVPEPVRWADIFSREFIKENYQAHINSCEKFSKLNSYFLKLSKLR